MNYKWLIAQLLPYRITKYIKSKKRFSIIKFRHHNCERYDTLGEKKDIISVQGFGYSGSGAVVDLLREYQNFTVWGIFEADSHSSNIQQPKNQITKEIDFLRLSGGLFELEKYIGCKNIFIVDNAIKRCIRLFDSYIQGQPSESILGSIEFKQIIAGFLDTILDQSINTGKEYPYNPHLRPEEDYDNNYIFSLKDITLKDFRLYCKKLLEQIFSLVKTSNKIVLDQFLSDGELNYERNKSYLPNHKIIIVFRDPRDVFATSIQKNISWMPKNGTDFIHWYKFMHECLEMVNNYPDALLIRFENLVLDYDNTVDEIEKFLGINNEDHISKHFYFNPQISKNNIGLYNSLGDNYKKDINKISEELKKYCYSK